MNDYIIFGGIDSRDYNVHIFDAGTDNAPARVYERYEVAGRNGDLLVDQKRFENMQMVYWGLIYENYEENLKKFRGAMRSKIGYQRLEGSMHDGEYFDACFIEVMEVQTDDDRQMGKFQIILDRKPQRWLNSGEVVVSYPPGMGMSKNLIPYPYLETTRTENGLTFTDNGDGTITVNGTATATTIFQIKERSSGNTLGLEVGTKYTISGCPSGGSGSTYKVNILKYSSTPYATDYGSGASFTYSEATADDVVGKIRIIFYSGASVSNLVFKPMIRLASDTDDTWMPYYDGATQIYNPTPFESNPLLRVYGTGTMYLGDYGITISAADEYTDIDCFLQEAYKGTVSKNANVEFLGTGKPAFKPGVNNIQLPSGITKVEITPRWYTI